MTVTVSCDLWQCDSDVMPTIILVPKIEDERKEKKSQKKLGSKLHKSDTGIKRNVGQYIEGYDMC